MPTVTPRLDLDVSVVEMAKRAVAARKNLDPNTVALDSIPFSETADLAVREFGERIMKCLDEAGFRRQNNVERGRPRRLPEELWSRLEEMATTYDTSRITILRAALALLAAELRDADAGENPTRQSAPHGRKAERRSKKKP